MTEAFDVYIEELFGVYLQLYEKFCGGLHKKYVEQIWLSKELLHCSIKATLDDIKRFEDYAGTDCADKHKQAAFAIKWIARFRPIQLKECAEPDKVLLTINEAFAMFVGFTQLNPLILNKMSKKFYEHFVYTLTYRDLSGKGLSTLMYLIEKTATNGVEI